MINLLKRSTNYFQRLGLICCFVKFVSMLNMVGTREITEVPFVLLLFTLMFGDQLGIPHCLVIVGLLSLLIVVQG